MSPTSKGGQIHLNVMAVLLTLRNSTVIRVNNCLNKVFCMEHSLAYHTTTSFMYVAVTKPLPIPILLEMWCKNQPIRKGKLHTEAIFGV